MMSTFNTSNPSRCHHHQQQQHHHLLILLVFALFSCTTAQNSNNSTPPSLAPNFNPSMAIIIGVLISAFFFMGFFSIYIRQCAGEGRSRDRSIRPATNETAAAGRSGSRAQRGLDPSVMETFPTFVYSVVKGLKIGNGALECAVCLNQFEDDETLRLLPKCDHVFHPECIDAWLVSHVTCPVCRANLTPDSSTTTNNACSDEEEHEEESETNENENEMSVSVGAEDEQETQTQTQATETVQVYTNSSWIPIQNRPARSKSSARQRIMSSGKFPRSHSTGHSLQIQPGENCDRFTLRLPKHVRKQIILSRTRSTFPVVGDGSFSRRSSRRGCRGCGGGSSRRGGGKYYQMWKLDRSQSQSHSHSQRAKSDRWVFSMAPPFLSRTVSVNSEEEGGWVNSRNVFKTPNFDCSSLRVNGRCEATSSSSSSTRLPV